MFITLHRDGKPFYIKVDAIIAIEPYKANPYPSYQSTVYLAHRHWDADETPEEILKILTAANDWIEEI